MKHLMCGELLLSQYTVTPFLQGWRAARRHCAGDQWHQGEHVRGDLPGRPQQQQHHSAGAERTEAAPAADDTRVHGVTLTTLDFLTKPLWPDGQDSLTREVRDNTERGWVTVKFNKSKMRLKFLNLSSFLIHC